MYDNPNFNTTGSHQISFNPISFTAAKTNQNRFSLLPLLLHHFDSQWAPNDDNNFRKSFKKSSSDYYNNNNLMKKRMMTAVEGW